MKGADHQHKDDESLIDKAKGTLDGHDHNGSNDKRVSENGHGNAPDEGKEDVPTEDKIIRDPETGEETFIKNNNKNWKLK